jgi:hypothetical protein
LRRAFDPSAEHRLNPVDGDVDDLLPDLHVRLGMGHARAPHIAILKAARGRIVISGGCV